jgi:hypothetical protein
MNKHTVHLLYFACLVVLLAACIAPMAAVETEGLSAAEFSGLIHDLSEEGGYFMSDNFTSSEDSYLTIADKLQQLAVPGGAYIGVGPEQNFTYIARIRPRIAFIVDIRRQAMIQHLMYKAIFRLAPTRALFLSRLLSRPIPEGKAPAADAPLDEILATFDNIPANDKTYAENLAEIRNTIQKDFQFPLSTEDQQSLEYVFRSFRNWGFQIGYESGENGGSGRGGRGGRGGGRFGRFPNFKQLLGMKDLKGTQGSFLASAKDYDFVLGMQNKNLIIPVVGDFSGKKALAAVGEYLRKRKITVSVFYVSNVEIVLLDWGSYEQFSDFVKNVKKLPTDDRSLLLRSTFSYYDPPAQLPGYQLCNFLQKVPVFLREFDQGRYRNYDGLITTTSITPAGP